MTLKTLYLEYKRLRDKHKHMEPLSALRCARHELAQRSIDALTGFRANDWPYGIGKFEFNAPSLEGVSLLAIIDACDYDSTDDLYVFARRDRTQSRNRNVFSCSLIGESFRDGCFSLTNGCDFDSNFGYYRKKGYSKQMAYEAAQHGVTEMIKHIKEARAGDVYDVDIRFKINLDYAELPSEIEQRLHDLEHELNEHVYSINSEEHEEIARTVRDQVNSFFRITTEIAQCQPS